MLSQIAEACNERDLERMARLLDQPRGGATAAQRQRFETFARLFAAGLIEDGGFARQGFFAPAAAADLEMDEPCRVELVLAPVAGESYRIRRRGPDGGRTTIMVEIAIEDFLEDGGRVSTSQPWRHGPTSDLLLSAEQPFRLEVPELPAPGPVVKIRRLSFHGRVFAAGFESGGEVLPITRLELAPLSLTRFPKGFRKVAEDPTKVLAIALQAPATHQGHVLVASWLIARDGSREAKERALAALVETLRSGPASAEKTVLACLPRIAAGDAPAQRDREAWLRWWIFRQRERGQAPADAGSKEGKQDG